MKTRIPWVATVIVALAVAAMIGLGFWQLGRRAEKEQLLARYASNPSLPETAYPANPADQSYMFRRVSGHCLRVVSWQSRGTHLPDGRPGWRQIATCATGAEGPGIVVDIGVSASTTGTPRWNGGDVHGIATSEPENISVIERALSHNRPPPRLMIVSDRGLAGLAASPRPDPSEVPNNHLAYAVQWFLFAAVATIIYVLALRWRDRKAIR